MQGRKSGTIRGLALSLVLVLALGGIAEAKKKGGNKAFKEQKAVNQAIPSTPPVGTAVTPLLSQLKVPKKFKKRVVGDLNVTGFQTTGSAPGAANDLDVYLIAPGQRTVLLLIGIGDQSIGPLTLDDDTATSLCDSATPPCADPFASLNRPFAGTANLFNNHFTDLAPTGPLSDLDGVKMRGTWTLAVYDAVTAATDNSLNQWGLRIKPAKPVSE